MNSNPSVESSRSPERTRPRLFQDLPLFAQRPILAAKTPKLVALLGRQTVSSNAFVAIGLRDPIPNRLRGRLELLRQLLRRTTRADEIYQPTAELIRVWGTGF